ncbi:histidinol dehydrogenase, partial [Flavobacterium circumlabens]
DNPKPEPWSEILKRPTKTIDDIEVTVKEIFREVQKKGDEAIAKYTSIFDGISLDNYEVSNEEIQEAISLISDDLKEAIQLAKNNIYKFHNAQKTE